MCGIVGYIGNNQAASFLLDGRASLSTAVMIPLVSLFMKKVRSLLRNV